MAPHLEVHEDDAFPVYTVIERDEPSNFDPEIAITEEELADYTRVCEEYDAWQEKLKKLHREASQAKSTGRHVQRVD